MIFILLNISVMVLGAVSFAVFFCKFFALIYKHKNKKFMEKKECLVKKKECLVNKKTGLITQKTGRVENESGLVGADTRLVNVEIINKKNKLLKTTKKITSARLKTDNKIYFTNKQYQPYEKHNYLNGFLHDFGLVINCQETSFLVLNKKINLVMVNNCVIKTKTQFMRDNYIEYFIEIKNLNNKKSQIKLLNKFNVNLSEPCLKIINSYSVVNFEYNINLISLCYLNNNKFLNKQFNYSIGKNEITCFTSVNLKPQETKIVKVFMWINLNKNMLEKSAIYLEKVAAIQKINKVLPGDYSYFFSYNIITKNKRLNDLINSYLPSEILHGFYKQTNENNLYKYIFNKDISHLKKYSYQKTIKWLLNKKEYVLLYKYILEYVLGFKLMGNIIYFNNSFSYMGKIVISYKNKTITKYNLVSSFYFTFNNIIYRNVNVLNLQQGVVEIKV